MKFPDSPRVRYLKSPLVEVICQLRFPKILKIETEVPVDFQEAVRKDYPNFDSSRSIELPLQDSIQSNLPPVPLTQRVSHQFLSKESDWRLAITSDFIALTTSNYTQWEEFRDRLTAAIELFTRLYDPSHFTRVGLRYKDLIIRSELGLEKRPWRDFFITPMTGILATEDIPEDDLGEIRSIFACSLDYANATAKVSHGLASKEDSTELGYLIDSDFSTQTNTEVNNVIEILDQFNRESGCLLRWCITEELHQAMEPQPIEI